MFRNAILTISMLMGVQAFGMEAPLQPDMIQDLSTLQGLPTDVKGCIFKHLATADIAEMEREILVLAATNKQLINRPQIMIAILDAVSQKVKYTAHVVQLVQRLQTRKKTLPIIQDAAIGLWLTKIRKSLCDGALLYELISEGCTNSFESYNPTQYIKKALQNGHIDLDWRHHGQEYHNSLMRACHDNETVIALLFINAGASIDWRTMCTSKQLNALEANCPYIKFAIDDAFAARKKKLALKQPVKQLAKS
jgi:hypothetical protein